jgi:hypothetical protein
MKWTDAQTAELRQMCMDGASNAAIAEHFGLPVTDIHAKRSALGITIPKVKAMKDAVPQAVKPEPKAAAQDADSVVSLTITEQERKFLAEFAEKQYEGAKDNVGTRTPIHVVERIEKTFVEDGSDEVWVDDDNNYEAYEYFDDLIAARRQRGEELPDYDSVEYEDVGDVWISNINDYCKAFKMNVRTGRFIQHTSPVAFFLIRDEAVRYMKGYQAHNCADCRIFTYGLGYSNNGDLPVFRELLMRMGKAILQDGMK